MKMTYRKIAIFLTLSLTFSLLPISATAATDGEDKLNEKMITDEGIRPNEINELDLSVAASGYESEPNNSWAQANPINEDTFYMSARLPSGDSEDWFLYTPRTSGLTKIILSNIPSNCDFDLEVLSSTGAYMALRSTNGGNTNEVISFQVDAYYSYCIRVSAFGSARSTSYYWLDIERQNEYSAMGWNYFFNDDSIRHITYGVGPRSSGNHYGVDIVDAYGDIFGTDIFSVTDGWVLEVFINSNANGYGIAIDTNSLDYSTGNYLITSYMHMKERPNWQRNDYVHPGDFLGEVGSSGRSTGPHLHFQVSNSGVYHISNYSHAVNPILCFPDINFTGDTSIYSSSQITSHTHEENEWIAMSLVDHVGEDLVLEWINSSDDYKDIIDFIIEFGIDGNTFEELSYQYGLNEIYNVDEIQYEVEARR